MLQCLVCSEPPESSSEIQANTFTDYFMATIMRSCVTHGRFIIQSFHARSDLHSLRKTMWLLASVFWMICLRVITTLRRPSAAERKKIYDFRIKSLRCTLQCKTIHKVKVNNWFYYNLHLVGCCRWKFNYEGGQQIAVCDVYEFNLSALKHGEEILNPRHRCWPVIYWVRLQWNTFERWPRVDGDW